MRRAGAFWRKPTALAILAALLLGLSACGNTIPNTGSLETEPQEALRLAPPPDDGMEPFQAESSQAEPALAEPPLAKAPQADRQLAPASGDLFCPILRYPIPNDLTVYPPAELDEPPPRVPFYDSVFGACLARLTDRTADRSPFDDSTGMHAPGAAVQAFNADSSRILIRSSKGWWYVYNAETLQPVLHLPLQGAHEVIWDPVEPYLLYFLRGTSLLRYSLLSGQEQMVHNFADDFANTPLDRISAAASSSITADGQTFGLAGLDASGSALTLMVYSLKDDQVTTHLHMPAPINVQGIRITPSGSYLLASFQTACPEAPANGDVMLCGLVAFDQNLSNPHTVSAASGSFDTALDSDLNEVVVYHDQTMHSISMYDLQSGAQLALLMVDANPAALNLDISGRGFDKPGWALASVYSLPVTNEASWLDSSIVAFELKSDGLIARLAQNQSVYADPGDGGWVHPGASPNPDFTRVVFNSNWGSASGEIETYIIALPEDWANPGQ